MCLRLDTEEIVSNTGADEISMLEVASDTFDPVSVLSSLICRYMEWISQYYA